MTKDAFLPLIAAKVLPLGGCLLAEDARYTNQPYVARYSTTNFHEAMCMARAQRDVKNWRG